MGQVFEEGSSLQLSKLALALALALALELVLVLGLRALIGPNWKLERPAPAGFEADVSVGLRGQGFFAVLRMARFRVRAGFFWEGDRYGRK